MAIPIVFPASSGVRANPWRERPSRLFGGLAAVLLLFMVTLPLTQEFLFILLPGLTGQAIPPVYLTPTVMVVAIFSYVAYVFLGLGVIVGAEKVKRRELFLYGAGIILGAAMFPTIFLNLDSLTAAGCQLAPVTNEAGFVLGCSDFLP